ncbi:MAG: SPASM domain-containing protein [Prevotellaceae bacterium]|jgi:uncharacterized protein|nr:SPASM domain-containing protein [Prevotellaceae bacterium]
MNYEISKYIHTFISSKGYPLIYCSRTNAFLKITKELYDFVLEIKKDSSLINELDDSLLDLFKNKKIIVKSNEDEDYLLERQFNEEQISYSQKTLSLTLVPTLSCNFDCPYCFEEGKRVGNMKNETIEQLILFIKKHESAKQLDITWYGGEPLLAFGVIQKVLSRINEEINIPVKWHTIVTNGYYFTNKVIDFFKLHPLNCIQITLDGDRERHDKIRKQKSNGEGSYDKIINNIDTILNELPDTQISIRVNIEKENLDDFICLQRELSQKWEGKKITLYPGILRIENEDKTALACEAIPQWDALKFYFESYKKKILNGNIYPVLQYNEGCCATMINAYIVGPKGEIYKCWNDVSDDSKIVGYIHDKKLTNSSLFFRYLIGSKFYNNEDCKQCFFLPICPGYCPWFRLKNQHENGKYILCQCIQKAPNMLNDCLEYWYETNANS